MRPGREWKGKWGVIRAARSRLLRFFSFTSPCFTAWCFFPCSGCFFFPELLADEEEEDDDDDEEEEAFLGSTWTSEAPQQNPMAEAKLPCYNSNPCSFFLSALSLV
jgi:hypothetical protein